jgi:hypothetical protein
MFGMGILYEPYLAELRNAGFRGALIMHGMNEDEVEAMTSFFRPRLAWHATQE